MNDKIVRCVVLGVSAMVGFAVTETVYNMSVKWLHKVEERDIIEMMEAPEELES